MTLCKQPVMPANNNNPRRKRARNRAIQKNAVLTTAGNFFLALAIGATGSAFAPLFTRDAIFTPKTAYAFIAGIAFFGLACYLQAHKEKER